MVNMDETATRRFITDEVMAKLIKDERGYITLEQMNTAVGFVFEAAKRNDEPVQIVTLGDVRERVEQVIKCMDALFDTSKPCFFCGGRHDDDCCANR